MARFVSGFLSFFNTLWRTSVIFLLISAATVHTLKICNGREEKKFEALTASKVIWSRTISNNSICKIINGTGENFVNCTLKFSLCGYLPCLNATSQACLGVPYQNSSKNNETNLGNITSQMEGAGTIYFNLNSPNIMFSINCNRTAIWPVYTSGNYELPAFVKVIEISPSKIMLQLPHHDVCLRQGEAPSIGSVLLILFFTLLLVYLCAGITWNYMNGARGLEIIPNYGFWSELPGYVADGCTFFVKFITCQLDRGEVYERI